MSPQDAHDAAVQVVDREQSALTRSAARNAVRIDLGREHLQHGIDMAQRLALEPGLALKLCDLAGYD